MAIEAFDAVLFSKEFEPIATLLEPIRLKHILAVPKEVLYEPEAFLSKEFAPRETLDMPEDMVEEE
jgi:hypothetical protein